jgi:hypothetical protein
VIIFAIVVESAIRDLCFPNMIKTNEVYKIAKNTGCYIPSN